MARVGDEQQQRGGEATASIMGDAYGYSETPPPYGHAARAYGYTSQVPPHAEQPYAYHTW